MAADAFDFNEVRAECLSLLDNGSVDLRCIDCIYRCSKVTTRQLCELVAAKHRLSADDAKLKAVVDGAITAYFESQIEDEAQKPAKKAKKEPTSKAAPATAKEKKPAKEEEAPRKSAKKEDQLERLKKYVFQCGVRKIWKKELEGMSASQSVQHLMHILQDELNMEGRPTLEKCKKIKQRREYEAELASLDPKNIIASSRRRPERARQTVHDISSDEVGEGSDSPIDFSALGDPDAE